jgi:hypothetical protein
VKIDPILAPFSEKEIDTTPFSFYISEVIVSIFRQDRKKSVQLSGSHGALQGGNASNRVFSHLFTELPRIADYRQRCRR